MIHLYEISTGDCSTLTYVKAKQEEKNWSFNYLYLRF